MRPTIDPVEFCAADGGPPEDHWLLEFCSHELVGLMTEAKLGGEEWTIEVKEEPE